MSRVFAEVIASAFASGLSWQGSLTGKPVYCLRQALKGSEAMSALERFVADHPNTAEKTYGDALSASLSLAFPSPAR